MVKPKLIIKYFKNKKTDNVFIPFLSELRKGKGKPSNLEISKKLIKNFNSVESL